MSSDDDYNVKRERLQNTSVSATNATRVSNNNKATGLFCLARDRWHVTITLHRTGTTRQYYHKADKRCII